MIKLEKLTSLPIEFYEAKWFSFSRDEKMPRFIPVKSVLVDSSNYRFQNGSDVYISRVVKNFLEPEDITAITQAHRNMVDEFSKNEVIQTITMNTLELKILKENGRKLLNDIFGTTYQTDDEMHKYMHSHKNDCAITIFESTTKIKYPEYIMRAIKNE